MKNHRSQFMNCEAVEFVMVFIAIALPVYVIVSMLSTKRVPVVDRYEEAAKIILEVLYPAANRYNDSNHSELIPMELIEQVSLEFKDFTEINKERKEKRFYATGGHCNQDVPRKIELSIRSWDDSSAAQKEMTILHEYGHCLFNFGHTNGVTSLGGREVPASIMDRRHSIPDDVYLANKEYYFREMFGKVYRAPNLSVPSWYATEYSPEMSDEVLVELYGDQTKGNAK